MLSQCCMKYRDKLCIMYLTACIMALDCIFIIPLCNSLSLDWCSRIFWNIILSDIFCQHIFLWNFAKFSVPSGSKPLFDDHYLCHQMASLDGNELMHPKLRPFCWLWKHIQIQVIDSWVLYIKSLSHNKNVHVKVLFIGSQHAYAYSTFLHRLTMWSSIFYLESEVLVS